MQVYPISAVKQQVRASIDFKQHTYDMTGVRFSNKTEREEMYVIKAQLKKSPRIKEWMNREAFVSKDQSLPKLKNRDVLGEILNKFTIANAHCNVLSWQSLFPLTGEMKSKPEREAQVSVMKFLVKEQLAQFHPMNTASYWTMDNIRLKALKEFTEELT